MEVFAQQLGLGSIAEVKEPTEIAILHNIGVCKIQAGECHMAALTGTFRIVNILFTKPKV